MRGDYMRIISYLILLVLVSFGVSALSGCAATSGITGSAVVVKGSEGYQQETRVMVDNDSLARAIKITDLKSTFAGDLLRANVTLYSKRTDTLALQYKFRWYNSQGIEIDPESSPWQPIIIYGRETKSVQAVAPNPSAKEFKIEIRYRE